MCGLKGRTLGTGLGRAEPAFPKRGGADMSREGGTHWAPIKHEIIIGTSFFLLFTRSAFGPETLFAGTTRSCVFNSLTRTFVGIAVTRHTLAV